MKTIAALFVLSALLTGIFPQFTDCQSQGKAIVFDNGYSLPMKCHWTAQAAIAVAAPLLLCGAFLAFARHKETIRFLALVAALSGVMIVLLPTSLIGVCAKADMLCRALMLPVLTIAGSLTAALGTVCFFTAARFAKYSSDSGFAATPAQPTAPQGAGR